MMVMMEKYQNQLEDLVDERTTELREEKRRTENLLQRMLPVYAFKKIIEFTLYQKNLSMLQFKN